MDDVLSPERRSTIRCKVINCIEKVSGQLSIVCLSWHNKIALKKRVRVRRNIRLPALMGRLRSDS